MPEFKVSGQRTIELVYNVNAASQEEAEKIVTEKMYREEPPDDDTCQEEINQVEIICPVCDSEVDPDNYNFDEDKCEDCVDEEL